MISTCVILKPYGNTLSSHFQKYLKGLVQDYANWKINLLWHVFKSALNFACSLQLTRNILGCIFFTVLRFVFKKKHMQKTQEVWLICNASLLSLSRQTKGFFCFSFNKRSQKHAAAKTWVFCIRFFSKTKRKTAKKKCSPMYF